MVKQVIGAPTLVGGVRMPLSKAVRAGDFIFVAGQIAFESSGRVADGPIETQTRLVLDSIKATLEHFHLNPDRIRRR
jgi:2-iminobutanoate/2-iminopropanoate deaminase